MKKTRISSILLSLIIFLQLFSNISFAKSFNDTDTNWAQSYIDYISNAGIVNGYEDGSFKPSNNITRAEVLKLISLYHAKNLTKVSPDTSIMLNDIDESYSWITEEDFNNVLGNNYMNGYSDNTFKPSNYITRAEFAKTMYNMKDFEPKIPEILKSVHLVDIDNHWANVPIRDLSNRGIINGYEDGSFRPDNYISRAEAVTVLAKFNGFKPIEEEKIYYEVYQGNTFISKFSDHNSAIEEALKYSNSRVVKSGETIWNYNDHRSDFTVYQSGVFLQMYEDGFDTLSEAVQYALLWANSTIKQNGVVVWDFNVHKSSYNVYQGKTYLGSFSTLENAKLEGLKWAGSIVEKNGETVWRFTKNKLIVIDPGHGGSYTGAVSASKTYYEKNLTLSVSLKLRSELEKRGYTVLMTRETDIIPFGAISDNSSLVPRINFANDKKADMFISVHFNSIGMPTALTATGIETFYGLQKPQDKPLSDAIQKSMMTSFPTFVDRKVKSADFSVLRNSKVPSTLVELGFISNPIDEYTLVSDQYHKNAAIALANGIDNYFK